uniref:Uncharacterized protein n=1 Tax=Eptatretus burgeri TaxID=7764 RepID=A0A8C4PZN3_EPTBU
MRANTQLTARRHETRGRPNPCVTHAAAGVSGLWADRSALHEACVLGRVLQVRALIQSGLCVNMMTADSVTPLHEASQRGHTMCARLLLEAGAQVEARNIDGSTPLCDACSAGHLDCAKLLLAHGAKVNLSIFTVSPLHEACLAGSLECVQLLIQAGANLEAHDCHLGTALHVACYGQHHDCAKVLLDAVGPNVIVITNAATSRCFIIGYSVLCLLSHLLLGVMWAEIAGCDVGGDYWV